MLPPREVAERPINKSLSVLFLDLALSYVAKQYFYNIFREEHNSLRYHHFDNPVWVGGITTVFSEVRQDLPYTMACENCIDRGPFGLGSSSRVVRNPACDIYDPEEGRDE